MKIHRPKPYRPGELREVPHEPVPRVRRLDQARRRLRILWCRYVLRHPWPEWTGDVYVDPCSPEPRRRRVILSRFCFRCGHGEMIQGWGR